MFLSDDLSHFAGHVENEDPGDSQSHIYRLRLNLEIHQPRPEAKNVDPRDFSPFKFPPGVVVKKKKRTYPSVPNKEAGMHLLTVCNSTLILIQYPQEKLRYMFANAAHIALRQRRMGLQFIPNVGVRHRTSAVHIPSSPAARTAAAKTRKPSPSLSSPSRSPSPEEESEITRKRGRSGSLSELEEGEIPSPEKRRKI